MTSAWLRYSHWAVRARVARAEWRKTGPSLCHDCECDRLMARRPENRVSALGGSRVDPAIGMPAIRPQHTRLRPAAHVHDPFRAHVERQPLAGIRRRSSVHIVCCHTEFGVYRDESEQLPPTRANHATASGSSYGKPLSNRNTQDIATILSHEHEESPLRPARPHLPMRVARARVASSSQLQ
jgi:hypothetical protein